MSESVAAQYSLTLQLLYCGYCWSLWIYFLGVIGTQKTENC